MAIGMMAVTPRRLNYAPAVHNDVIPILSEVAPCSSLSRAFQAMSFWV